MGCKRKYCCCCCFNRRSDYSYEGFPHRSPPKATNRCDKRYRRKTGTPATLSMGCYWGAQSKIDSIFGVIRSRVGKTGYRYAKMSKKEDNKLLGPIEVVDFEFDKEIVTYREILEMFFRLHNPFMAMALPESQCQSVIFYHSREQKKEAEQMIKTLCKEKYTYVKDEEFPTKIVPAEKVIPSKREHQHYELQLQHHQLLEALGVYQMSTDQIMYSHVLCRLNGYLANRALALQIYELDRQTSYLDLNDEQDAILILVLIKRSRGNSLDLQPGQIVFEAAESSIMIEPD